VIKKGLSVLFLIITVLGLYNVYAEDGDTLMLAEGVACEPKKCVRLLERQRTPFGQSFVFQTRLDPPRTSQVRCQRAYLLAGAMTCEATKAP
jgi:hypothetical protein